MRRFENNFKKLYLSRRPGIKRAGNLFQDFLLGIAAGGRLVFSFESLGQSLKEKITKFYSMDTIWTMLADKSEITPPA